MTSHPPLRRQNPRQPLTEPELQMLDRVLATWHADPKDYLRDLRRPWSAPRYQAELVADTNGAMTATEAALGSYASSSAAKQWLEQQRIGQRQCYRQDERNAWALFREIRFRIRLSSVTSRYAASLLRISRQISVELRIADLDSLVNLVAWLTSAAWWSHPHAPLIGLARACRFDRPHLAPVELGGTIITPLERLLQCRSYIAQKGIHGLVRLLRGEGIRRAERLTAPEQFAYGLTGDERTWRNWRSGDCLPEAGLGLLFDPGLPWPLTMDSPEEVEHWRALSYSALLLQLQWNKLTRETKSLLGRRKLDHRTESILATALRSMLCVRAPCYHSLPADDLSHASSALHDLTECIQAEGLKPPD